MITEIAVLTATADRAEDLAQAITAGITHVRENPGCLSAQVLRGVEQPDRFVVAIAWASLEAHVDGFRGSPAFARWIGSIKPFLAASETQHYSPC
ncbi:putative quinol monooxygenase [Kutzneria sp. 744]|uniref:putative quinol monooxygenase n=1 Tax=Kutzneria sp. (strain 744) TaxID=345341 RepID=UPI0003EED540|nr:antibiotic biosynthesis monooxygenase family protein [Kutzneria sp. 744]EWM13554.1 antibiotic biosynthesis monooxygenase [Kutzneria sp. 744]